MQPDVVGTWLFHCHVNDHINAGMMSFWTVKGSDRKISFATVATHNAAMLQSANLQFVLLNVVFTWYAI